MTIRGVLLDIGGVLYVGDRPVAGAGAALAALRAAGPGLCFVTNTTSGPKRAVFDRLARMGFEIEPRELFTPAAAARDWLAARGLEPWLLVAPPLLEDFPETQGEPNAVVIGDAGPGFTYEALNRAFRMIMGGAPLIALAKNRYFMTAGGLTLDAGAFVSALEYAAGVEATTPARVSHQYGVVIAPGGVRSARKSPKSVARATVEGFDAADGPPGA